MGGLAILTVSFIVESDPAPISLSEYSDFTPFSTLIAYDTLVTSAGATALKSNFKPEYWKMEVGSSV